MRPPDEAAALVRARCGDDLEPAELAAIDAALRGDVVTTETLSQVVDVVETIETRMTRLEDALEGG